MKKNKVVMISILVTLTIFVVIILMLVTSLPNPGTGSNQERQNEEEDLIEEVSNFTPQKFSIVENGKSINITKLRPARDYKRPARNSSLAEHYCTPDEMDACNKIFTEILPDISSMNMKELSRYSKGLEIIRLEGGIDDFWDLQGDLNSTTNQEKFKAIQNIGNLEGYPSIRDLIKKVTIENDTSALIEINGLSYLKDKSVLEEINEDFIIKGETKEIDGVGFVNGEKYVAQVKSLAGLGNPKTELKTISDVRTWVKDKIKERQLDAFKSEIENGNTALLDVKKVKIVVPRSQYEFVLSDGKKVGEALDEIRSYTGYPFKIELESIPESYMR